MQKFAKHSLTYAENKAEFADDPSWVESQQNRWLAFLEHRVKAIGEPREMSFTQIEEACGLGFMEARAIMESAAKRIRNTF